MNNEQRMHFSALSSLNDSTTLEREAFSEFFRAFAVDLCGRCRRTSQGSLRVYLAAFFAIRSVCATSIALAHAVAKDDA
jgi:hypothetical protein